MSGEATISIAFNGRVGKAILAGEDNFFTIWDGQVLEESWAMLIHGVPNADKENNFLGHLSAPKQQAEQVKYINYGPMLVSTFDISKSR